MKKFAFLVLMVLLPLQSVWAAVQVYHSHGTSETLHDVVFHDHSHEHTPHYQNHEHSHAAHDHHQSHSGEQSDTSDHHHHIHVHTISVLTEVHMPEALRACAVQQARIPAWLETLLVSQIDRPNWR